MLTESDLHKGFPVERANLSWRMRNSSLRSSGFTVRHDQLRPMGPSGLRPKTVLMFPNCKPRTVIPLFDHLYLKIIPEWLRKLNTTVGLLVGLD